MTTPALVLEPGVIDPPHHDQAIDWMNQQHALVFDGTKTLIWTKQFSEDLRRSTWRQASPGEFNAFYNAYIVAFHDRHKDDTTLGKYWLTHPRARRFRDVVFDPSERHSSNSLNLWQGYQVSPSDAHDCARLKEHLFEVIAGANDERYRYLFNWLAYMFQRPTDPIETAIVLRGDPGAGKGIVAKSVGRLLGEHFLHITHNSQLTNKFNGFLANALFVFSDESVWAGDRAAESTLKALITEPTLQIQRKGREYVTMRNCVHLIMASNEDWVIPVRMKDRRFVVLDVMPKRDRDYYNRIVDEQRNGGAAALLHELLHAPIEDWNPRDIPATNAKEAQFVHSLPAHESWWFDCLYTGNLDGDERGWPTSVSRDELYRYYLTTVMERWRKQHPLSRASFGRMMNRFLPMLRTTRPRAIDDRHRHYILPTLDEARKIFEGYAGQPLNWPLDDEL